jgi:hypothetical protein
MERPEPWRQWLMAYLGRGYVTQERAEVALLERWWRLVSERGR